MTQDPDFKFLLENQTSALLMVAADLTLLYLNPAAESLLGISREQALGEPLVTCFHESASAWDTLRAALQAQRTYMVRQVSWHLHTGQKVSVDYSVTPLPDGKLLIEVQQLDRMLRISREEATSAAQETTRNLVRGLAHEIKNPLGGIRGAAQLLGQELSNEDLKEYTRIIIGEADRLRKLVDRLLGSYEPEQPEAVNIHEVTERAAAIIRAESGGVLDIQRDYDPSIPDLVGHPEQLFQAVLNVVRNAWEALEDAKMQKTGRIVLRTRVQHKFTIGRFHHPLVCRVDIIDNGPGIPASLLEEIFFPMISGRPEGTGLGLAIAQQLVAQHFGLIDCESQPGNTRFSIYIPITPPPALDDDGQQKLN